MGAVLSAFLVALLIGLIATPLVGALARKLGWSAEPREDRWGSRKVALTGGIAIFVATLSGVLVVAGQLDRQQWALLGASSLMFVVGFVDDRKQIKPHTKLIAQVVAAGVLVEAGFRFGLAPSGPWLYLDQLVTILFLIAVGNALNLLDNMDGLCAGVGAITALTLTILQAVEGHYAAAALISAVMGASLGFLRYNFNPASIFMGDCGSLFLGLYLGGAALLHNVPGQSQSVVSVLALPVLVLLIPLMDTTLVTFARQWARRPVSQGGCDHSSHRLVAIGLSERGAVLFLYALALAGGLVALAVRYLDWYLGHLLLPLFLLAIGAVGIHLAQVRVYPVGETVATVLDRTPIPLLCQQRYRRRTLEVLIDTVCIAVGFYVANLLRHESALASPHLLSLFKQALPVVIASHLVGYFYVGVYRGLWRHTSVADLPRFVGGVAVGLLLTLVVLAARHQLAGYSPTVFIINALLQLWLLTGSRLSFKLLRDILARVSVSRRRRVLVVGWGEQAELVLRRMRLDNGWEMEPAGVVCDEPDAVGLELLGTPVLGTSDTIRDVLQTANVTDAVLVDDAYPPEAWVRICRVCAEYGVVTRTIKMTLCAVGELTNGAASHSPGQTVQPD